MMGADPRETLLLLLDAPYLLEPLQTCNHKWLKIFPQTRRFNCIHPLNEKQTNLTASFVHSLSLGSGKVGRYYIFITGLDKKLDWTGQKNKQI